MQSREAHSLTPTPRTRLTLNLAAFPERLCAHYVDHEWYAVSKLMKNREIKRYPTQHHAKIFSEAVAIISATRSISRATQNTRSRVAAAELKDLSVGIELAGQDANGQLRAPKDVGSVGLRRSFRAIASDPCTGSILCCASS